MMRMFIDSGMNIMYYRSYLCVKRKREKADERAGFGGVLIRFG
jgi:hypothetical protein